MEQNDSNKPKKILKSAYGSTPHLPGSRLGTGEHTISSGLSDILTQKNRGWNDLVVVQEKLDGACVCVYKDQLDKLHYLTRAGYDASKSNYHHHALFYRWANFRAKLFELILNPGERIVGEWLALAHGTKYSNLSHKDLFVAFEIFTAEGDRLNYFEFLHRLLPEIQIPKLIHIGEAFPIEKALRILNKSPQFSTSDGPEGLIYRLYTDGKFNTIAKYVKASKEDGKYLTSVTGLGEVWNI